MVNLIAPAVGIASRRLGIPASSVQRAVRAAAPAFGLFQV